MISCLCVTHERPAFMPWLLWNFDRLNYKEKELIIVDSSAVPFVSTHEQVRVVAAPGANVPAKRNIALAEAGGDAISWLDDDDWRHPQCLKILSGLIGEAGHVAGGRWLWFCNLQTGEVKRFCDRKRIIFNCMLVETAVARQFAFDESMERGSDTDWLLRLTTAYSFGLTYDPLCMLLCHDDNLGNKADVHRFNRPLEEVTTTVGKRAWGGTSKQLDQLKERLRGN